MPYLVFLKYRRYYYYYHIFRDIPTQWETFHKKLKFIHSSIKIHTRRKEQLWKFKIVEMNITIKDIRKKKSEDVTGSDRIINENLWIIL